MPNRKKSMFASLEMDRKWNGLFEKTFFNQKNEITETFKGNLHLYNQPGSVNCTVRQCQNLRIQVGAGIVMSGETKQCNNLLCQAILRRSHVKTSGLT